MKFTVDDKNWLTFNDGKELYNLSYNKFRELAFEAKAVVYWGIGQKIPRVNKQVFGGYFEQLL